MTEDYRSKFEDEHLVAKLHAAVDEWFKQDKADVDPVRSLFHELLVVGVMVWASNEVLTAAIDQFKRDLPDRGDPTQLYLVSGSGMGHYHVVRTVQEMIARELGAGGQG